MPTQAVIPICILLLRQVYMKIMSWYNQLMGKEVESDLSLKTKTAGDCCGGCDKDKSTSGGRRGKRFKSVVLLVPEFVESVEEYRAALKKAETVVVKFTAEWCGPCKAIEPTFVSLYHTCNEKMKGDVLFIKVDVDLLDEIAQENKISMMPTFVVFRNEKIVAQMSGSNEGQLESFIEKNVLKSIS